MKGTKGGGRGKMKFFFSLILNILIIPEHTPPIEKEFLHNLNDNKFFKKNRNKKITVDK